MTEEAKTEKKEKLSFVKKCILLVLTPITVAVIVGIINLFIPNFLGLNPIRELTIYESDTKGLLNNNALPNEIIASYFLKSRNGKHDKKISSLFLKTIIIRNTGNKGAENVPLSVCAKGENIFLIDNPEIKTFPMGILDALDIKKTSSTNNKHKWEIPLLKPEEAVMFEYMIYSEKPLKNLTINVLSRKKDWKTQKASILTQQKNKLKMWQKILLISFSIAFLTLYIYVNVRLILNKDLSKAVTLAMVSAIGDLLGIEIAKKDDNHLGREDIQINADVDKKNRDDDST